MWLRFLRDAKVENHTLDCDGEWEWRPKSQNQEKLCHMRPVLRFYGGLVVSKIKIEGFSVVEVGNLFLDHGYSFDQNVYFLRSRVHFSRLRFLGSGGAFFANHIFSRSVPPIFLLGLFP